MEKLLTLLEQDAKLSAENLAAMVAASADEVKAAIAAYEKDGTILGYKTVVNWDRTQAEKVTAIIEVRVTPSKGEGFDKVAQRIAKLPEVKSVILMSGGYDFMVTVEGKSMKDIAFFVSEKLSSLESVLSTATHFMLKKYKYEGVMFDEQERDERELFL